VTIEAPGGRESLGQEILLANPNPMTTNDPSTPSLPPVASTGVDGLDAILHGGLPRAEMHLIQGVTGTGKTTLALRFLSAGLQAGEPGLYVTLSQSKEHLERIARSHGWSLDGITIYELSPGTVASRIAARQTVLPTAELELGDLFRELSELVLRVRPRRAVVDSITILQMLAGGAQRYHQEVVTLRQLFVEQDCTLVTLANHPAQTDGGEPAEVIFHPLSGCVIQLQQVGREYGIARRRLRVVKARGLPSNTGLHDLQIRTGEVQVFPRLGAYDQPDLGDYQNIATGLGVLDEMLGGGLETGTACLIVGPSGVGKSTLSTLYADAVAASGARAGMFLFDERPETHIVRAEGLGIPLRGHVTAGRVVLQQLDPGEISPGEFAQQVRNLVDEGNLKLVVIDSVVGYFAAMGTANVLATQLHELLTFLTRRNVLLILCGSQQSFMSIGMQEAVDVSYLSDTIVAVNFFETEAQLRRAIAVVKKKHGPHSTRIHELTMEGGRVQVGAQPLVSFRNLMVPRGSGPDPQATRDTPP
jgi:circadian clock protein KaiC